MNDKQTSMEFWKKMGERGYFGISKDKSVLSLLTKAISYLPDNCTVLDIGGNNFSEKTSSRTIYDLLKERKLNFKLHIADIVPPVGKLPENVFFHEGDMDDYFNNCTLNRINLVVAINTLQEPVNYQNILRALIQRQNKGDMMFIVNPIKLTDEDNVGKVFFSLMRGYKPNSINEGELEEILTAYKIERSIIEDKKEGPPKPTKEAIEATTGVEKARTIIKKLKAGHPKLREMIDSYLSALNGGSDPVVNYGRCEIITAIKH